MSEVTCSRCGKTKPTTDFCISRRNANGRQGACRACCREFEQRPYVKARRKKQRAAWYEENRKFESRKEADANARIKLECLSWYSKFESPVCNHPDCLVCDIDMLTIDHVNGGGMDHRRLIGARTIYRWLIKNGFPEGFQVLCMNHNFKKGLEERRIKRPCGV